MQLGTSQNTSNTINALSQSFGVWIQDSKGRVLAYSLSRTQSETPSPVRTWTPRDDDPAAVRETLARFETTLRAAREDALGAPGAADLRLKNEIAKARAPFIQAPQPTPF